MSEESKTEPRHELEQMVKSDAAEMDLNEFVKTRWEKIPAEVIRALDLANPDTSAMMLNVWVHQYVSQRHVMFEGMVNELLRKNMAAMNVLSRLVPEEEKRTSLLEAAYEKIKNVEFKDLTTTDDVQAVATVAEDKES